MISYKACFNYFIVIFMSAILINSSYIYHFNNDLGDEGCLNFSRSLLWLSESIDDILASNLDTKSKKAEMNKLTYEYYRLYKRIKLIDVSKNDIVYVSTDPSHVGHKIIKNSSLSEDSSILNFYERDGIYAATFKMKGDMDLLFVWDSVNGNSLLLCMLKYILYSSLCTIIFFPIFLSMLIKMELKIINSMRALSYNVLFEKCMLIREMQTKLFML